MGIFYHTPLYPVKGILSNITLNITQISPLNIPPSAANTPRTSEAPKMPVNEAISEQRGS